LARWVFPTIGFDGWLYHCSQSAATNFRSMALGNLRERGFWDIFYDYDLHSMTEAEKMMAKLGCRCDRKAHLVNGRAEK
jgi:MoaA/NifB/PqqE/SkfB family radical SAM enzyme